MARGRGELERQDRGGSDGQWRGEKCRGMVEARGQRDRKLKRARGKV